MIKCLIIEDEQPAQQILKTFIKDLPVLHLEGCLNNAIDAIEFLKRKNVDLIFLDIHLPKISGLNFLRTLKHSPKVIITSAYPEYAIEGYELDVMDYLLKPFSFERFVQAVNKYRSDLPMADDKVKQKFLLIKNGKGFDKVNFDDISYLMSDGDLVKINTDEATHVEFHSLKRYESVLPGNFIRVHKSYIINLDQLKSLSGNRLYIKEKEIPIGRNFKNHLMQALQIR